MCDSLLFEAAKLERVIYDCANPAEINDALMEKAEIYKQAGMYSDALSTLSRVRMYAASPQMREALLVQKALCAFLSEDYDASLSYLAEMGIDTGYVEPKLKSEWAAMILTLLVPAGYLYVGAPGEGLVSTLLNAASIGWIVLQISSGCYVSGILGGCLALNATYMGAQQRVATLLEQRNSQAVTESKRMAASTSLMNIL